MKEEVLVIVVGAGPSGIATSACLNCLSISNIALEREDCFASLWKKKSYDRLQLHLPKKYCELPHMAFPSSYPTYVPRKQFIEYLDDYVSHFEVSPLYNRSVELATFDENVGKWYVKAKNIKSNVYEEYMGMFLVVATGETSDPFIPNVEGLDEFGGEMIHSTQYKSGKKYGDKSVLVIGSGNSGMEIAVDLSNNGAKSSIVVRSPVHILHREMVNLGFTLMNYLPLRMVDWILATHGKLIYGDMSKYGITRPKEGPLFMKVKYGKYPVIDMGFAKKIKSGEIQVLRLLPAISRIMADQVEFATGKLYQFDAIIFATGFKTSTNKWLKDDDYLLNENGFAKPSFPNNWKGKNGLYCVGLARRGLHGAAMDAEKIANDIKNLS